MSLSAFLYQNALKTPNRRVAVSPRFLDENGEAALWEIRCITGAQDEELRRACLIQVPVPGKKNQFQRETDYEKYLGELASICTVQPELTSAELQNSYGVMGAQALLKTMLTPGEYSGYLELVQELNGFDKPFEAEVTEAKN